MFKGSIWYPDDPKKAALLVAIFTMIVLQQSELVGLYSNNTMVFGWLPAQIAYDMAYNLVGFLILVAMYIIAPEAPKEIEPSEVEQEAEPDIGSSGTELEGDA